MQSAAVTQHVNMRAEPKNEAAVVMIVPEGKTVELVDCGQWCEVVYDDRQGFIHKRFVAGLKE
jgi:SH3-like domain-containing protein